MNRRPVTLKDIAHAAGVSVMTVSYSLRGSKQVATARAPAVISFPHQFVSIRVHSWFFPAVFLIPQPSTLIPFFPGCFIPLLA
ncbi:MAG: LacI family DNA-binding transcriptional regulator [Opitutales bacterium]|nr:LacI family DNA-binding transcriptional regulator [Opitutales bacterium]